MSGNEPEIEAFGIKHRNEEAKIRALLEDWIEAIRVKDVHGATSNIAPDILLFDVVDPLRYTGADSIKKRTQEWFSSFHAPIGYEMRDLSIAAGDTVAFSHSLNRVNATRIDGKKLDMWWRATICFRKVEGKWMVTHEHNSVPFDTKTGLASLELKPSD
ncbi:MAG: nuclear transport factor 2 family protein [Acidobacteriaceae bacterium]